MTSPFLVEYALFVQKSISITQALCSAIIDTGGKAWENSLHILKNILDLITSSVLSQKDVSRLQINVRHHDQHLLSNFTFSPSRDVISIIPCKIFTAADGQGPELSGRVWYRAPRSGVIQNSQTNQSKDAFPFTSDWEEWTLSSGPDRLCSTFLNICEEIQRGPAVGCNNGSFPS